MFSHNCKAFLHLRFCPTLFRCGATCQIRKDVYDLRGLTRRWEGSRLLCLAQQVKGCFNRFGVFLLFSSDILVSSLILLVHEFHFSPISPLFIFLNLSLHLITNKLWSLSVSTPRHVLEFIIWLLNLFIVPNIIYLILSTFFQMCSCLFFPRVILTQYIVPYTQFYQFCASFISEPLDHVLYRYNLPFLFSLLPSNLSL